MIEGRLPDPNPRDPDASGIDEAHSELKYRSLFQHMPVSLWQVDVRALVDRFAMLRAEGVTDLDAYIETHPDFLSSTMRSMRTVEVNELSLKLFGARSEADLIRPIDEILKISPETLRRSLVARYAGAESFMEETQLSTLDGRVVDVLYTSALSPALSRLGMGLVGFIDISDRIAAEHRLRQVEEEFAHAARVATLGELTASIAHEVNQPLAAIATSGEASLRWLDRERPDLEEVRILAGRIVADAQRAASIIARVRTLAARQTPRREVLDLREIAKETVHFLRHELRRELIRMRLLVTSDVPLVRGDRTQLQQVLMNLILNGVQAMSGEAPERRQLTVETADLGDGVQLEVEDLGAGIPVEHRQQLFQPFFTTRASGLGLGLSICQSIIESHGGAIAVEHPAIGTRFIVRLPAVHGPQGQ